jgi:SAM-dependent methyltransferase
MCNLTGIAFGEATLTQDLVAGRTVLEVGALDVNGSLRPFVESLGPARYVGVDISPGPRVDEVVDATDLIDHFGADSFDLVITTEMLEHVRDWRVVVHNLKGVISPGGHLVVTTRSIGFPYHGFPHDFWRYEPEDMQAIFADFDIRSLEQDPAAPGVFMMARKPERFSESSTAVDLFSIVSGRRQRTVSTRDLLLLRLAGPPSPEGRPRIRRARRGLRRAATEFRRRVVSPIWRRLPGSTRSAVKHALGRGDRSEPRSRPG